jgi:MarR family 2-MHQ and catechol resistance regulon transcriptional repressor
VGAFRTTILISSGSLTAAVDRLENAGLVERRGAAADRRSRIVHLTPVGSTLIRRHFGQHASDMEAAVQCLDNPERLELAVLLRKLGKGALETGGGVRGNASTQPGRRAPE